MSLIGPRPTLRYQVEHVHGAAAQAARRPAGPDRLGAGPRPRDAAVGRPDRARRLVRRAPLALLDLKILLRTPLALFGGTYRGAQGGWRPAAMAARYGRPALALLGLLVLIAAWNALRYPPGLGYDATDHIAYAAAILDGHGFPDGVGEYYTPPGFYAVAAGRDLARRARRARRAAAAVQLVNAVLLAGDRRAPARAGPARLPGPPPPPPRRARPLRVRRAGAAVGGDGAPRDDVAVLHDPGARARGAHDRAAGLDGAVGVALGAALGAAQLVRAFSLWTFGVVVLVLARRGGRRGAASGGGSLSRSLVTLLATGVVAGPWYAYQSHRYTNPIFDRPAGAGAALERRPASFYVDPELRARLRHADKTTPRQPLRAELYTDGWGDYYGVFVWNNGDLQPVPRRSADLRVQMWLAIVPTLLLVGGWLVLLVAGRSRASACASSPERLLVGLLPLAGIVGMLYFTVSYPTPDGDVDQGDVHADHRAGLGALLRLRARRDARAPAAALLPLLAVLLGLAALSGLRLGAATARLSASSEAAAATLSLRDRGSLHLRRSARRHRRPRSAGPARPRSPPISTGWRPRSTTPTTWRSCRGSTIPAMSPALAALVAEHDVQLVVPRDRHRPEHPRAGPGRARARPRCSRRRPRCARRWATSTSRTCSSRSTGSRARARGCPGDVPDDARYPAARQGARGFGSRHIYRAADAAELAFFLAHTPVESMVQELCVGEEFSIDVFCDLEGRCLNAIARTMIQSKGGESIKGMSILDAELIEHGAPGRRDDRHRRAGMHPVLPRAGRVACRSRTSTRASAGPSRCRSPPAAATRARSGARAVVSAPSPGVGEYRATGSR